MAALNAADEAVWGRVFANGPVQAGLASGVDKFSTSKDGISMPEKVEHRNDINRICALTFESIQNDTLKKLRPILKGAVILALKIRELTVDNLLARPKPDRSLSGDDWYKNAEAVDETTMGRTITAICAMKATWWMTNHHTGQGEPTGYFRKWLGVAKADIGFDGLGSEEQKAFVGHLWRIGHWFDTKVILAALGVDGIDVDPDVVRAARNFIAPAPDLVLRLSSNPAGSAKVCDLAVAAAILHASVYRSVVNYSPEYTKLARQRREIMAAPVMFHEGCKYLTGRERHPLDPVDDTIVETLATFIKTTRGKSTIADAIVIRRGAVNGELESRFKAVTRALAEAKSSEDEMKAMLAAGSAWPKDLERP